MNTKKNPWTINSLAVVAGELMFTDQDYIQATKDLIEAERERVCLRLSHIEGIKYYPPSANFILLRILKEEKNADILFEKAIRKKFMIRNCSTFPFLDNRYVRFCFMKPKMNDGLLDCIEEAML
jgi:threonine-phosphate decarboxylase